jgi:hypothetical protein
MVIIEQRSSNTNGQYILKIGGRHGIDQFVQEHSGKAYFMMYDLQNPNVVFEVFSNTLVNNDVWHLIKGERIGNTINLYVDGNLEASAVTLNIVNLNASIPTVIGYDQKDGGSYFNGLIDDVQVEICVPGPGGAGTASPSAPSPSMLSKKAVVEVKEKVYMDKLYPNPASNTIRIQLTEAVVSMNEIQVLDGFGKINRAQVRQIGDGVYELNISGLAKGMYFIKTRTASGIKTFKFIKI